MQIFKAHPLASLSSALDQFDGDFVLATTHCKFMEALSSNNSLSELLQLSAWIRTRRNDEQNWFFWN